MFQIFIKTVTPIRIQKMDHIRDQVFLFEIFIDSYTDQNSKRVHILTEENHTCAVGFKT